ncbi:MAG: right-handed parallel beta-helix repeat-containing protein [Candidatus Thorarchaeota archaeon]
MSLSRNGLPIGVILLLTLSSMSVFVGLGTQSFVEPSRRVSEFVTSDTFTPHDAIAIFSDAEFAATASDEGWPGDGTAENPYVISGLLLTDSSVQPVKIWNTEVHWILENNLIEGGGLCGIWIDDTTNGIIRNNIIRNRHSGIVLENPEYLTVLENDVYNNSGNGIEVLGSFINSTIQGNRIQENILDGVYIPAGIDSIFEDNTIADNGENGIAITLCTRNIIRSNLVERNGHSGIIVGASNSVIEGNTITESGFDGLTLTTGSRSEILNNTLQVNEGYGVQLSASVRNATVGLNKFIGNGGDSQVCDHGTDNEFRFNYYDSWTGPDADSNEIVDEPYQIDGGAENSDTHPLTSPDAEIPDTTTTGSTTPPPPEFPFETLALAGGIVMILLVGIVVIRKRGV